MHQILMSEKESVNFLLSVSSVVEFFFFFFSRILHPNVVQFLGVHYPSPDSQLPWLVMELMYMSLTGLIEKYEREPGFSISFQVVHSHGHLSGYSVPSQSKYHLSRSLL